MTEDTAVVHATAVVIREAGVLIQGASGAGKTSLALLLIETAQRMGWFARLVGDDRIIVRRRHGALLAAPHPAIAGLVERRTRGVVSVAHEPCCRLALVVALGEAPLPRLPDETAAVATLAGVDVPLVQMQAPLHALSCGIVFDALATA